MTGDRDRRGLAVLALSLPPTSTDRRLRAQSRDRREPPIVVPTSSG
jgi:hypothetical protein